MGVSDIAIDEGNVRTEIPPMSAAQVVEYGHLMTVPEEGRHDCGPDEPGATGDKRFQTKFATCSCYP